jgi:hypothetical protein
MASRFPSALRRRRQASRRHRVDLGTLQPFVREAAAEPVRRKAHLVAVRRMAARPAVVVLRAVDVPVASLGKPTW